MTAYVDASVILRLALGQPNALTEWARMPTELGTLDAIHLATALLWKETTATPITVATHDEALGLGATAHGLPVVGLTKGRRRTARVGPRAVTP